MRRQRSHCVRQLCRSDRGMTQHVCGGRGEVGGWAGRRIIDGRVSSRRGRRYRALRHQIFGDGVMHARSDVLRRRWWARLPVFLLFLRLYPDELVILGENSRQCLIPSVFFQQCLAGIFIQAGFYGQLLFPFCIRPLTRTTPVPRGPMSVGQGPARKCLAAVKTGILVPHTAINYRSEMI